MSLFPYRLCLLLCLAMPARAQDPSFDYAMSMMTPLAPIGLEGLDRPAINRHYDRDNDRKLALINQIVPRALRPSFLDFAAVRGSALFEGFQSGRFTYRSFVLRKTIG